MEELSKRLGSPSSYAIIGRGESGRDDGITGPGSLHNRSRRRNILDVFTTGIAGPDVT